jgi:non-specific serine/threonine protein kinase/serine/threonine-protein kinase
LNHEPVTAAAPGACYRIGKFIRRHRFGFATASALVALLVAGVVVSTWQAVRATRAEKEARTMAAFLEDMLNSVKPEQAKGKDTTLLRQMLDRAAARVDTELKSQPLTEAGLRHTLGEVYVLLGDYPKAETMFRRSLEVRERTLGKDHPATLDSVNGLAALLKAKGDYVGALPLWHRVLQACERKLGKEDPGTLEASFELAEVLLANGDCAGAEPLARKCLAFYEQQSPDAWLTFSTRSLLGGCLLGQKKPAEAEPLLLSGYEGMKQREDQIPASSRPRLKEALQRLVQLYETTDRKDQATEWKRKLAEFEQAEAAKPPVPPAH